MKESQSNGRFTSRKSTTSTAPSKPRGGADGGPTLKGSGFLGHWTGETLASLYVKIRDTMPQTGAGTVSEDVKIEILAYLLQQNSFPAGSADLKIDLSALD